MSAPAESMVASDAGTAVATVPRRRVVFVDDEQLVLNGLENITRRQRKQWDMRFVVGGPAALELLAREPADLIVSDMRMPGMDGAQLLEEVRLRHPEMSRIILSGQADGDSVWRAIRVAQQFLSKPCEIDRLRAVVGNTLDAQRWVRDVTVRARVGKLESLRLSVGTRPQLEAALAAPKVEMAMVCGLIERDPAMFLKVLQLVSTAFFGSGLGPCSVQSAVEYLGFDALRTLVAGKEFEFEAAAAEEATAEMSTDRLRARAYLAARVARRLAPEGPSKDLAFAAAMLSHTGRHAMASVDFAAYQGVLRAYASGQSLDEAEAAAFHASNEELGAFILTTWGISLDVVNLVAAQRAPEPGVPTDLLLFAVQAGVALAGPLGSAVGVAEAPARYAAHAQLVAEEKLQGRIS